MLYLPHNAAVVMPLNSNLEMLLQLKDSGYLWAPNQWCFFGGAIEEGETPDEAVRREISEEFENGELLKNISYFGVFPFYDIHYEGRKREGIMHVFSADFVGDVSKVRITEGKGFAFLSRQEMDDYPIMWHNRRIIDAYYNKLLAEIEGKSINLQ